MKYDVDTRGRSYRPERIELHYDRLHNPDNCYHIRIDWMTATAKLVEDAVETWAREAAQFGLRLVEVPIKEACAIQEVNPFRKPFHLKLALAPPSQEPETYFDPNSQGPQTCPGKNSYQTAILRKFDFVLDLEAASNFPSNVDVSYSWGKPDFRYTQYIHRSGVALTQITDDGDFLILANRLYSTRAYMGRDRELHPQTTMDHQDRPGGRMVSALSSHSVATNNPPETITPISSPLAKPTFHPYSPSTKAIDRATKFGQPGPPEPEAIKAELEAFCNDVNALEAFYKEILDKDREPHGTPATAIPATAPFALEAVPEASIPNLGLPPGILGSEAVTAAVVGAREDTMRLGSPMSFVRRTSVQYDGMGLGSGPITKGVGS